MTAKGTHNTKGRIQCNLRIMPDLHRYLKASAKRRGGSLNGELNLRLEISRAIDTHEAMQRAKVPAKAGNRASRSEA